MADYQFSRKAFYHRIKSHESINAFLLFPATEMLSFCFLCLVLTTVLLILIFWLHKILVTFLFVQSLSTISSIVRFTLLVCKLRSKIFVFDIMLNCRSISRVKG
jgi:hypothetical protein